MSEVAISTTSTMPTISPVTIDVTKQDKKTRVHYNQNSIITMLATSNPKRKNTLAFKRFELYKTGMKVADYIKAGGRTGDINYDVIAGFIMLSNAA
jgi:hypothetical protein